MGEICEFKRAGLRVRPSTVATAPVEIILFTGVRREPVGEVAFDGEGADESKARTRRKRRAKPASAGECRVERTAAENQML